MLGVGHLDGHERIRPTHDQLSPCGVDNQGDGSDVVDVMPPSALSIARDGLGYHCHSNEFLLCTRICRTVSSRWGALGGSVATPKKRWGMEKTE